jgi:ubiquinone/menaquinone biosynthesis C-methylase UbiE
MWLLITILLILLVSIAILFLIRPMKVPRDTSHEKADNDDSIIAYNCVSSWAIFKLERHIIIKALNKIKITGRLLDVGCGPGYLAAQLSQKYPDVKITGLDNSEMTVTLARSNWPSIAYDNLEFIVGDAQRLPVTDDYFDVVISSLSLHHLTDAQAAFREIHRVLKPGGRFLIFDLRRDAPYYFYLLLKAGQALLAPKAIKKTNGAVGSFWAAYTTSEIKTIVSNIPWENLLIKSSSGWMLISGSKME